MNKRAIWQRIMAVVLVTMMILTIFSVAKAQIIIPKIFTDVSILHPFATFIGWLKSNGITSGYADGTFRPDNFISRAEMAVMLKNTASTVVAAGAHVTHDGANFVITDWFNNVNGQEPTNQFIFSLHSITFGFDMTDKFVQCTVDMDDSRTSFCSARTGDMHIRVSVYDVDSGSFFEPHGFWILVYGKDIQP